MIPGKIQDSNIDKDRQYPFKQILEQIHLSSKI